MWSVSPLLPHTPAELAILGASSFNALLVETTGAGDGRQLNLSAFVTAALFQHKKTAAQDQRTERWWSEQPTQLDILSAVIYATDHATDLDLD